jgi:hypothetical protein
VRGCAVVVSVQDTGQEGIVLVGECRVNQSVQQGTHSTALYGRQQVSL